MSSSRSADLRSSRTISATSSLKVILGVQPQCCSLKQNYVRPELVEGLHTHSWWFDRLTTNGKVNSIVTSPVSLVPLWHPPGAFRLRWGGVKLPPAKPGAYWVSPSKGPIKP